MEGQRNMKVIEGHLTAVDKKAVKAILDAGQYSGKVGRATYKLVSGSIENGIEEIVVEKFIKDRGLIPVPGSPFRISKYVSKIQMK